MQCDHCGQQSDWVGERSDWDAVTSVASTRRLYECNVCGNRQRAR